MTAASASSNNSDRVDGQEVASGPTPDPAKEPLITPDGRPTPRGWRRVGDLLAQPMSTRSFNGRGGQRFEYVTARQVAKRLDDVVGPGNWSDTYRVLSMEPWIVECTLTVCGVAKSDVGYSNTPDAEPGEEAEPAKAAFSDSFKRAACKWAVGRWLYRDLPVRDQ
jgi:Rad52/22 family double-strand break repair protein